MNGTSEVVQDTTQVTTNGTNGHSSTTEPEATIISNTKTPRDCWESAFVWGFILRFTDLQQNVEGLENITDFEDALQTRDLPQPIMHPIVSKFIFCLTNKKDISVKTLGPTLVTVINDFCDSRERSIWWNKDLGINVPPFKSDLNFFELPWTTKLEILRQLVDWQLGHNSVVRGILDRAYGVPRGAHHRKKDGTITKPTIHPPAPHQTKEKMEYVPVGQDAFRRRYWMVDDSPRVYRSGNPWKHKTLFETISNSKEEFLKVIQDLEATTPEYAKTKPGRYRHWQTTLIAELKEKRLPKVEAELERLAIVKKRILDKIREREAMEALRAQMPVTRTRRKTQKVDYVYNGESDEEDELQDDDDEPMPAAEVNGDSGQVDEDYLEEDDVDQLADDVSEEGKGSASAGPSKRKPPKETDSAVPSGVRRSGRTSNLKRRSTLDITESRGERRSSRLTRASLADADNDEDETEARPKKRSRMGSTSSSAYTADTGDEPPTMVKELLDTAGPSSKYSEIKPTEKVVERLPGKKKSKFWFYAVEVNDDQDSSSSTPAPVDKDDDLMEVDGVPFDDDGTSSPGKRSSPQKEDLPPEEIVAKMRLGSDPGRPPEPSSASTSKPTSSANRSDINGLNGISIASSVNGTPVEVKPESSAG